MTHGETPKPARSGVKGRLKGSIRVGEVAGGPKAQRRKVRALNVCKFLNLELRSSPEPFADDRYD